MDPWISVQDNYREINAEAALRQPDSVFHYYQALIRLRKELPVIREGDIAFLYPNQADVFAYRRTLDGAEALVLCNLLPEERTLPLTGRYEKRLGNYPGVSWDGQTVALRPYEAVVLTASHNL